MPEWKASTLFFCLGFYFPHFLPEFHHLAMIIHAKIIPGPVLLLNIHVPSGQRSSLVSTELSGCFTNWSIIPMTVGLYQLQTLHICSYQVRHAGLSFDLTCLSLVFIPHWLSLYCVLWRCFWFCQHKEDETQALYFCFLCKLCLLYQPFCFIVKVIYLICFPFLFHFQV